MRIRWKLLILLLAFALVPICFLTLRAQRSTARLGRDIGERAQSVLTTRAIQQLRMFVQARAQLLDRDGDVISLTLQSYGESIEDALAHDPPTDATYYSSYDYRSKLRHPDDMHPSERFFARGASSEPVPLMISTNNMVMHAAPDTDKVATAEDFRRLTLLTSRFHATASREPELIFWQYAGLESGAFGCYPGSAAYEPDFDHRKRAWYAWAQRSLVESPRAPTAQWTPPYRDAATDQVVISAVRAVRYPDGSFAGAVGIDVHVPDIARRGELPAFPLSAVRLVIPMPRSSVYRPFDIPVFGVNDVPVDQLGLYVLAKQGDMAARDDGEAHTYEMEWIESADEGELRSLMDDMVRGGAGVKRMQFAGEPSVWAYAPLTRGRAHLLVIARYDDIVNEAERAEGMVSALIHSQFSQSAMVVIVLIVLIVVAAIFGARAVTSPISRLAEAANRLAHADYDVRVPVSTHDEIGELSRRFNEMVPQLEDRMHMRHSLDLAMEVQQHLLPATAPKLPGLDIHGQSNYCDETGGDYYDFVDLSTVSKDQLGVAVGDVTGHGIAAALLMATGRALLRSNADRTDSLAEMFTTLNRQLVIDSTGGRFMTLFYMLIDTHTRSVRWVSAGHDAPIVLDLSTGEFRELDGAGLPLGIEASWVYEEYSGPLSDAGELIVIGTDGIWEARNSAGDMFGKDGLRDVVRAHRHASAAEVCDAVTDALKAFCGAQAQEDDITLVAVKVLPKS